MTNTNSTLRKHYPGCYRLTLNDGAFGQVKKVGREWHATIRATSGDIIRYAGIWNTRREAIEECLSIAEIDYDVRSYEAAR